jgi:hypothetical protein
VIQNVTFYNRAIIKVQAQIYNGRTLVSTCQAGPGEKHTLPAELPSYDIFFRDAATGWEIARALDSQAKILTLNQHLDQFTVTCGETVPSSSLRQLLRSAGERLQRTFLPQNGEPRRKWG